MERTVRHRLPKLIRLPSPPLLVLALVAAASLTTLGMRADASVSTTAGARATTSGTVLQTNLVSDLPGVAAATDPNLVNAWGISES